MGMEHVIRSRPLLDIEILKFFRVEIINFPTDIQDVFDTKQKKIKQIILT